MISRGLFLQQTRKPLFDVLPDINGEATRNTIKRTKFSTILSLVVPSIKDKINGHLFHCMVGLVWFVVSSKGVHLADSASTIHKM